MQELKMGDYINSPSLSNHEDPRKTEKKSSDSAVPCHTAPNATADWAVEDLVEMRYLLVGQRRQLDKDHDDLEARYQDCSRRRKSTWDLAQQDCRNRGAHLVTVNSKEEQ
ncbi:hypothetical protein NHX12_000778, partial [Muraenolepis orangiensis]